MTTPESLALLLAREDARRIVHWPALVIADEWHELMGSKRGVQTELAFARLRTWNPGHAHVGPFRHAGQSGYRDGRHCWAIAPRPRRLVRGAGSESEFASIR